MKSNVQRQLNTFLEAHVSLQSLTEEITKAFELLRTCYSQGRKVVVCGNGGSAADSEHIVAELMKQFCIKRGGVNQEFAQKMKLLDPENCQKLCDSLQPALPAISLVSQTSLITAYCNDVQADMIFAQQIYGYCRSGDVVFALSTSGNSPNILNALKVAKVMGLTVLGLSGASGGAMKALCDVCICVNAHRNYEIQQLHQPLYHILCIMLEEEFFGEE